LEKGAAQERAEEGAISPKIGGNIAQGGRGRKRGYFFDRGGGKLQPIHKISDEGEERRSARRNNFRKGRGELT